MFAEVDSENFDNEIVRSDKPVLIDFWGPRCGPCLALMPKVADLGEKYADVIKIAKIDASKNRRLCMNLRVNALPTFLLYNDGVEVDRLSGSTVNINNVEALIKKLSK